MDTARNGHPILWWLLGALLLFATGATGYITSDFSSRVQRTETIIERLRIETNASIKELYEKQIVTVSVLAERNTQIRELAVKQEEMEKRLGKVEVQLDQVLVLLRKVDGVLGMLMQQKKRVAGRENPASAG